MTVGLIGDLIVKSDRLMIFIDSWTDCELKTVVRLRIMQKVGNSWSEDSIILDRIGAKALAAWITAHTI